jgi:NitT/TauT family transport system substrate-binding protein
MSSFGVLVARNDLPTPNAAEGVPAFMTELKGKKVGVSARGAPTETVMRFMLTKAGMDPDDVTYVAVGAGDTAIGALTSKQVDVLSMFEPTAATCRVTGRCKVVWVAADSSEPLELAAINGGGPSMQFTPEFIAKNPEVIRAVIQAFSEADTFFNDPDNTDKILQIVKNYAPAISRQESDEILRLLITQGQKRRSFHVRIDRKAVQAVIDYLYSVKMISRKMNVDDLVYEGAPQ